MKNSANSCTEQNHVNVPANSRIKRTYHAHFFNWRSDGSAAPLSAGWPVSLGNDEVAAVLFWLQQKLAGRFH